MRDVGDMNAEQIMTVGQEADADGVVEILGFFAVDGYGLPVAIIGPAGEVAGSRLEPGFVRLFQGVRRELGREVVTPDNDLGVDSRVVLSTSTIIPGRGRGGRTLRMGISSGAIESKAAR